ncbi:hypothetical protein QP164_05260 [Sphingomonas sp. LR59]
MLPERAARATGRQVMRSLEVADPSGLAVTALIIFGEFGRCAVATRQQVDRAEDRGMGEVQVGVGKRIEHDRGITQP